MLCEKCNKKTATVHMTQYMNGEKTVRNLCDECAVELGQSTPISIQDFFKGLIDMANSLNCEQQPKSNQTYNYRCEICGQTYEEFRQMGKLGCGNCYKTFYPQIKPLLKSIHGNTVHTGKIPHKAGAKLLRKRELINLKRELSAAVNTEEYEEAARLRDLIRQMERDAFV